MNGANIKEKVLNFKAEKTVVAISALYLVITSFLIGLKVEHWIIISIYNLCFIIHVQTRKFILAFTIFVIFGIVYDFMKAFPNYLVSPIDISSLYYFELKVFGFHVDGIRVTANEFFFRNHSSSLDIVSGLFYINWVPVPLAFAFYLYLTNKLQFLYFSMTFFFVNLIGFVIYYLHPAAPPWYVNLYGFDLHMNVPGFASGLARFDNLIRIPVFESIYSRNSNVFAALPSLHCAYPVVVLYYAIKSKFGPVKWLFVLFMAGIWFSSVYSGHHYITDVILGIICAMTGILIFKKIILKSKSFQQWVENYKAAIT